MNTGMIETAAPANPGVSVETVLREELAHGDAMLATIAPILRHLLANDEHSVFSDEIVAATRGMMSHVARQLLDRIADPAVESADGAHDPAVVAALVDGFVAHPAFLAHVHALSLEWQLTQRLEARLGLDPVLSPLLQALLASTDGGVAASAMALLAAQARFCQAQRRMELPLTELPGDLLHAALLGMRGYASADPEALGRAIEAEQAIRSTFDESRSRLGLIARIVSGMGGGATAALSVSHAGVAIFLSALALGSGQDRVMTVLATNESQVARLALALRASGVRQQGVDEQFVSLHPEVTLPDGFDLLGADRAAALLAHSAAYPGA